MSEAQLLPIYVDEPFYWPSKDPIAFKVGEKHGHIWCHMWCEPGNPDALERLHLIAGQIGMRRAWFQNKLDFPHYDLVPPRRRKALKAGAIWRDLAEWCCTRVRDAQEAVLDDRAQRPSQKHLLHADWIFATQLGLRLSPAGEEPTSEGQGRSGPGKPPQE